MDGSTESAGQSFEPYRSDVFDWAYRLLGNSHDADDVVQDVFLRWDRQCQTALPAHARGWLRRVTLNRAVDIRRSPGRAIEPLRMTECGDVQRHSSGELTRESDAGQNLDREIMRKDLAAAMNELTDVQRSVVIAKAYDGLTFAEIASEHGLAVSTVKTHWLRGVRTLTDRLKDRWAEKELA